MLTLGVTINPLSKLLAIYTQNQVRHCLGVESTIAYFRHQSEIYAALQEGVINFVPFGLEFLPTQLPKDLNIAALCPREHVGMVLIRRKESTDKSQVLSLKKNAKIWVTHANYKAQLEEFNPNLDIEFIKYDSIQAILKLREGEIDACLMSKIFVIGLNLSEDEFDFLFFSPKELVPLPGQGVYAILTNAKDVETRKTLKGMHNSKTASATNIERRVKQLFSNKDTIAAYCELDEFNNFHLWVAYLTEDGSLLKTRLSQSTHFELAEKAHENLMSMAIS